MTESGKLLTFVVVLVGAVLAVRQGISALKPDIPRDMPKNAYFVQSGYNLQSNEPTGQWIACRPDLAEGGDLCRVTDSHGTVIYQGEYLPLRSNRPLPEDQLQISVNEHAGSLWVHGPAENGPILIIPLANGTVLVPAADSYALAVRWDGNPEELNRIQGQN